MFDFDGTLADSLKQATCVMKELAKRHGYKTITQDYFASNGTRKSMKEMGNVMKVLLPKIAGRADTRQISDLVKEKLSRV